MAKCEFCDKGVVFGIKVSHSHRRTNRQARQGDRQRHAQARLCVHQMPPFG